MISTLVEHANRTAEKSWRSYLTSIGAELAVAVLIFLSCTAYLFAFRHYSSFEPDEGIVLEGAERILRGQVPYRDFFSFYTPGSFYLAAVCFKIFGDSLPAARAVLGVAAAICSVITYLLARRVCSRMISLFAAGLVACAGFGYRFLVLHNWYSTLLCSLAVYSALKLCSLPSWIWAFAAGSFTSLTFLFEQSKGAGLCLGLALGFFILHLRKQTPQLHKTEFIGWGLGFVWPMFLTFAYFQRQNSLRTMVVDWFWPVFHYTRANRVPYGFQNWSDDSRELIFHSGPVWVRVIKVLAVSPGLLVPVLPLVATALLVYWAQSGKRQSKVTAEYPYYVLFSSILCGLLVSVLIVRADIIHFMYLAPLWYVVLAWILGSRDFKSETLAAVRPYLTVFVATAFSLMATAVLLTAIGAQFRIETRRGLIATGRQDTVLPYIQSHTRPGDAFIVYPYLPLYYYLTETRSPVKFDYFQTGMNTPQQAQEIIDSLQSRSTQSLLLEPWFSEKIAHSWPATPLPAIAEDQVADYIARNYRICSMLNSPANWRFHYMVRKEASCP